MAQPEIPIDTLFKIMEFLSMKECLSVMSVCKSWHELDRFEFLWKTILSNYIQSKIRYYRTLSHHSEANNDATISQKNAKANLKLYNTLISHLEKFHQMQIVKEKSVNRANFEKYMDDEDKSIIGEKSSVFGMRFKKLASSALLMHYNLIMTKGLEEIKESFTADVVSYRHKGNLASYFLQNARGFTLNERVNNGLYAEEYWKRYSFLITDLFCSEIGRVSEDCSSYVIEFLNNFKPALTDKLLEKIFLSYWKEKEGGNDEFLEYLLNYVSIEGNFDRSEHPNIDIRNISYSKNFTRLMYLKKMFNTLYPNKWGANLQRSLEYHWRSYYLDFFTPAMYSSAKELVDNLCNFLDVLDKKSIDFTKANQRNLILYGFEDEIIDLLDERGLITKDDYKIIFHTFNYKSKVSHLFPKIQKEFNPYEFVVTKNGKFNFISTYFAQSVRTPASIYFGKFFQDFYHEKIDLTKLEYSIGSNLFRGNINTQIINHFLDYDGFEAEEIIESLNIMINNFTPPLNVSWIEDFALYFRPQFMGTAPYPERFNQHHVDSLRYAIQNILYEGIPFEKYCQSICHKYENDIMDFDTYEPGEQKMAYLYNFILFILKEMPNYFNN